MALYWMRSDLKDYLVELICRVPSHKFRVTMLRASGVVIGMHTSIHRGVRLYSPSNVVIGNHVVVNRDVLLDGRSGLSIADNVSISEGVMILSLDHDPNSPGFELRGGCVSIGEHVFLGARAIVLPGVTVMRGAVVGAGAVVTKPVEAHSIVAGVPARVVGRRNPNLQYELNYRKFLG